MGISTSFATCNMYIFNSISQFLPVHPRTNKEWEESQDPQRILPLMQPWHYPLAAKMCMQLGPVHNSLFSNISEWNKRKEKYLGNNAVHSQTVDAHIKVQGPDAVVFLLLLWVKRERWISVEWQSLWWWNSRVESSILNKLWRQQ